MYEGEILASLKSVPSAYWAQHTDEATSVKSIAEKICHMAPVTDDVRQDANDLQSIVTSSGSLRR